MAKKEKRFESVYQQGALDVIEVLVDKETGVNYLFRVSGTAGGMCPLLDREGKPVVTSLADRTEAAWEK